MATKKNCSCFRRRYRRAASPLSASRTARTLAPSPRANPGTRPPPYIDTSGRPLATAISTSRTATLVFPLNVGRADVAAGGSRRRSPVPVAGVSRPPPWGARPSERCRAVPARRVYVPRRGRTHTHEHTRAGWLHSFPRVARQEEHEKDIRDGANHPPSSPALHTRAAFCLGRDGCVALMFTFVIAVVMVMDRGDLDAVSPNLGAQAVEVILRGELRSDNFGRC